MEWEVKRLDHYTAFELEKLVSDHCKQGWEPISVVECNAARFAAFLKRPKPTPEVTPQEAQQDTQQAEYITPTAAHVGQMVEVRDCDAQQWRSRELLAVLSFEIEYRFAVRSTNNRYRALLFKQARVAVK